MNINQKHGFWIHSLKIDLTEKLRYKIKFSVAETVTKTFMYILKRLLAKFQVTLCFQNSVRFTTVHYKALSNQQCHTYPYQST